MLVQRGIFRLSKGLVVEVKVWVVDTITKVCNYQITVKDFTVAQASFFVLCRTLIICSSAGPLFVLRQCWSKSFAVGARV